jgi:predicted acyl esterase
VVQDVRGKNGSGGDFFPFAYEKADGMATLDWVLKQPFCNGDVGLWGVSHLGFAANEIASTGYPAVKAVFNLSGWSELEPFIAHGGSFHLMAHLPWFVMFKGGQNPPVRLFVLGDNEWRNFETWPPKAVETQAWYVDCAEMANGSVGTGTLAATRTELE